MEDRDKNNNISISKSNKTALLFGSTGLVGSHCRDLLLDHPAYCKVVCFQRKEERITHDKLEIQSINFDRMDTYRQLIKGHDVFLCLGTTMQKAGNRDTFYKVDHDYTVRAARIALENGASQLFLVSAVGANPDSWFFYSRVKGEIEEHIRAMSYWSIHIFRPSILLGERSESRFGEEVAGTIGKGLDWITGGLLTKYKPVEAEVVARAMVRAAQRFVPGIHVYPSHILQKLADEELPSA